MRSPLPQTFTSHTDWAWGGTLLSSDLTGYYTANWHKPVQVFHPTITSQTIDAHVARNVSLQQQQSQQQNENGEAFNATAAAAAVRKAISVGLQLPHVLGDGHGTFAPGASQRFVLADTYRIAGLRTLFVQDRFKGWVVVVVGLGLGLGMGLQAVFVQELFSGPCLVYRPIVEFTEDSVGVSTGRSHACDNNLSTAARA